MASDERRRPIRFEALERRETPAPLGGGAIAPAVARALRGTGHEVEVSHFPLSSGEVDTTGVLRVRAHGLGALTGRIETAFASNLSDFESLAALVARNGDQLDLAIRGTFPSPRRLVQSGAAIFAITGGTGAFAGATGGGAIRATLNVVNGAMTFRFNGTIDP